MNLSPWTTDPQQLFNIVYGPESLITGAWRAFFDTALAKEQIEVASQYLAARVAAGVMVSPLPDAVFQAFTQMPLERLKCVILGQDPAPEPRLATGLAFSLDPTVPTSRVPSVQRVLLELNNEGFNVDINNGDLSSYPGRGVFLLNTVLTIGLGQTVPPEDDHKIIWYPFSRLLMNFLDTVDAPVAFLLWGDQAIAAGDSITNPAHLKLEGGHPSPRDIGKAEFFCKGYFTNANAFLCQRGVAPVDWSLTPMPAGVPRGVWDWDYEDRKSVYVGPCASC